MTKEQTLELLKLLSALESWGYSANVKLPDFLADRLVDAIDTLTAEVLK